MLETNASSIIAEESQKPIHWAMIAASQFDSD